MEKKILIFGAGAVGGYYGGMLAKHGYDVTFIARGENYKALKNNGLTIIRDKEEDKIPIKVFDSVTGLEDFDYVIICTKSHNTREVCNSVKEIIGENTTVASFQNGVENEDIICECFGRKRTIGALAFVASKQIKPGVVYQFGYNGGFVGEFDKTESERVKYLSNAFQKSGVDVKVSKDIMADLWNKLVWNASFNPISVVTEKTVDQILENEETYDLLKSVMNEVKETALAHGINIRPDTVQYNIDRSYYYKGFKTSMLQDYEARRPIELEGIVGIVLKKAKEKNVATPKISKIYYDIQEKLSLKKS